MTTPTCCHQSTGNSVCVCVCACACVCRHALFVKFLSHGCKSYSSQLDRVRSLPARRRPALITAIAPDAPSTSSYKMFCLVQPTETGSPPIPARHGALDSLGSASRKRGVEDRSALVLRTQYLLNLLNHIGSSWSCSLCLVTSWFHHCFTEPQPAPSFHSGGHLCKFCSCPSSGLSNSFYVKTMQSVYDTEQLVAVWRCLRMNYRYCIWSRHAGILHPIVLKQCQSLAVVFKGPPVLPGSKDAPASIARQR